MEENKKIKFTHVLRSHEGSGPLSTFSFFWLQSKENKDWARARKKRDRELKLIDNVELI